MEIKEIKKMIKTRSEATRQASSISPDDLESLLVALRCVVIGNEDDDKDDLMDTTEFAWQDNKYEPQQQEQYLTILKSEVSGATSCSSQGRNSRIKVVVAIRGDRSPSCTESWHPVHPSAIVVLSDHTDLCFLLDRSNFQITHVGCQGQKTIRGCSGSL